MLATDEPAARDRWRRLARISWGLPACWMVLLAAWAGCASLDRGQTLVPSKHQVRTGPFVVFSNAPMPQDSPAIRCLKALEQDIGRELGYKDPATESPVEIYVLNDRLDFDHFLKFYYPELPPRRAFFIAKGTQRVVYAHLNPRLEEDLRHEATHAVLRGGFGDLPLWLDEGLAEYFEADRSRPDETRSRLDLIALDLAKQWKPDLERLESLTDIRQMKQRDYREAWAWVRLLLNHSEASKSVLMGYLGQADRDRTRSRLRPLLAQAHIDEGTLLAQLRAGPSNPVVAAPPARPGAVRLQDPAPSAAPPARGLLRRLGALLGL